MKNITKLHTVKMMSDVNDFDSLSTPQYNK